MSRSNGPGVPPNGWPADYRPPEAADPYQDSYYSNQQRPDALPPARGPRTQSGAPASRVPQNGLPQSVVPPQGYGQQPQAYPPGYGPPGYSQLVPTQPQQLQPSHYPPQHQYGQHQPTPTYPQTGHPTQPPVHPQRAPQNLPPADPRQPDPRYGQYAGGYDAPTGRPTAPISSYPPAYAPPPSAPPQAAAPAAYVPETTGRPTQPPHQRQQAYGDQWPPSAPSTHNLDPNGYDLGNYMPQTAPDPRTLRPTAPPSWVANQQADLDALRQPPQGQPPQPHAHGIQTQFAADQRATSQALETTQSEDAYDEHEDDYEDAPRKTRYGLIAASLVAAIAVGGGLAYAYKLYVAAPTQIAATPVVKSNGSPIKVKPIEPGGTKFANADSKMMEQLSGSEANGDGGPKTVKTLTMQRDGSFSPSPPDAASAQPRPTGGVPGMIIAGLPPPPVQPPATATAAQQPAAQRPRVAVAAPAARPPVAAAPIVPKVIAAAATPAPASAAAAAVAEEPAAAPPVKKPPAALKKQAPPSAVGGPTGANGFVAVLASVPASATSRVQAMQQYADLQQKYGAVLGSKAPDVVDAKLEKGLFHRLIVGPPGSRDAAGTVCTQLKAAGYTADCWVTAF